MDKKSRFLVFVYGFIGMWVITSFYQSYTGVMSFMDRHPHNVPSPSPIPDLSVNDGQPSVVPPPQQDVMRDHYASRAFHYGNQEVSTAPGGYEGGSSYGNMQPYGEGQSGGKTSSGRVVVGDYSYGYRDFLHPPSESVPYTVVSPYASVRSSHPKDAAISHSFNFSPPATWQPPQQPRLVVTGQPPQVIYPEEPFASGGSVGGYIPPSPMSYVGASQSPGRKRLFITFFSLISAVALVVAGVVSLVMFLNGGDEKLTQTEVVSAYLHALSEGDAAKALSYSISQPRDDTFLTDEILQQQLDIAPISQITVDQWDTKSQSVDYSLKIGDDVYRDSIQVVKDSQQKWKIQQGYIMLRIKKLPFKNSLTLFDKKIPHPSRVFVFPGALAFNSEGMGVKYTYYLGGSEENQYGFHELNSPGSLVNVSVVAHFTQEGLFRAVRLVDYLLGTCIKRDSGGANMCPFHFEIPPEATKVVVTSPSFQDAPLVGPGFIRFKVIVLYDTSATPDDMLRHFHRIPVYGYMSTLADPPMIIAAK